MARVVSRSVIRDSTLKSFCARRSDNRTEFQTPTFPSETEFRRLTATTSSSGKVGVWNSRTLVAVYMGLVVGLLRRAPDFPRPLLVFIMLQPYFGFLYSKFVRPCLKRYSPKANRTNREAAM